MAHCQNRKMFSFLSKVLGVMVPTFIIAALVLYCLVQVTLASTKQCKEATYSIPNRVLAGSAILAKSSPGLQDCVILCVEHDPLCESINYYRKTKVCELNNKTIDSNPEDMVDFELAIYMTNSVRLLLCNGFDLECGRQTDICHVKQGGNKCKACYEALGLENGKIPDAAITVSSYFTYDHRLSPKFVRLNSPSAWSVADVPGPHWLQVELGQTMAVKKVATQGRRIDSHFQWVTSYTVSSRVDASDWVVYTENSSVKVFQGNTDKDTVVSHVFSEHIKARFIRIYPKTWIDRVSMRVELYGCTLE